MIEKPSESGIDRTDKKGLVEVIDDNVSGFVEKLSGIIGDLDKRGLIEDEQFKCIILEYFKSLEIFNGKFVRIGDVYDKGEYYLVEYGIRTEKKEGKNIFYSYDIKKMSIPKKEILGE